MYAIFIPFRLLCWALVLSACLPGKYVWQCVCLFFFWSNVGHWLCMFACWGNYVGQCICLFLCELCWALGLSVACWGKLCIAVRLSVFM